MARYIVPPNIVVQGDQPITFNGVQYISGVGRLTPAERTALGIMEVVETPMPDPFYGSSTEDPAHPGQWLTTPFTPAEMIPRLQAYSRQARDNRAAAGVDHTIGPTTYKIPTDFNSRQVLVNARIAVDRSGPPISPKLEFPTATGNLVVATFTEAQVVAMEAKMEKRVADCLDAYVNLDALIVAHTVTTKVQIDAVYAAVP